MWSLCAKIGVIDMKHRKMLAHIFHIHESMMFVFDILFIDLIRAKVLKQSENDGIQLKIIK